jgi:hypothetical protein
MNAVGLPVACGAARSTSPPARCSTPRTFCVAKYRSATSPTKNGAAMAAIGLTVNGQWVSVSMPRLVMNTAMVVYQAPQMKNWRNIMTLSRAVGVLAAAAGEDGRDVADIARGSGGGGRTRAASCRGRPRARPRGGLVWRADRAASTARRDAARGGARRRPRPIYAPRRGALTAAPDGAPPRPRRGGAAL